MHDEFLAIGKAKNNGRHMPNVVGYDATGGSSYFSTMVVAPRDLTANALTGKMKPTKVWLNGEVVSGSTLQLKAGANPLVLSYDQPGTTYFVVATEAISPAPAGTLATRWWNHPAVLPFDVRGNEPAPVGWYRFVSPPGLRAMTIGHARGKVQAWADGQPLTGTSKLTVPKPSAKPVTVLLRIEQERGFYGGAALPEPIKLHCGPGLMELGDWSQNDGLLSYSGGARYRKKVTIPATRQVMLNLGDVVASAEVHVNGHLVGVKVAPPWTLDITKFAKAGENRIEVLVCNTLANHYTTVPTRYRGQTTSGLLGPVQIEMTK